MNKLVARVSVLVETVTGATRFISLGAPVMLLLAAACCYFAFNQVQFAVTAGKQSIAYSSVKSTPPKLNQVPFKSAGYLELIKVLERNNPSVKIELTKDQLNLLISVDNAALLPEWSYAIATLQSERSGVLWSATKLCMAKCENGVVVAELHAYTQEIGNNKH